MLPCCRRVGIRDTQWVRSKLLTRPAGLVCRPGKTAALISEDEFFGEGILSFQLQRLWLALFDMSGSSALKASLWFAVVCRKHSM